MPGFLPRLTSKHDNLIVIPLFGVIILVFFIIIFGKPSCSTLECLSMNDLDNFRVKEIYQKDSDIYRALHSKDSDLLRIDIRSNISEPEASKRIQVLITRMKALFENRASPYPGEISDEIACGEEFKPVFAEEKINGIQVSYITGYLNERLVLGVCTEDQVFYKEILALFYCPETNQLYQLEIIVPKNSFMENKDKYLDMLYSISCKPNTSTFHGRI